MSVDLFIWSKKKLQGGNKLLLENGYQDKGDYYERTDDSDTWTVNVSCEVINDEQREDEIFEFVQKFVPEANYYTEINFMGNFPEDVIEGTMFHKLAAELDGIIDDPNSGTFQGENGREIYSYIERYGTGTVQSSKTNSISKKIRRQLLSTNALLGLVAIAMIVFIVIFTVVNPANKTIGELTPVIIICAVICAACIGMIMYFSLPRKNKIKDKNIATNDAKSMFEAAEAQITKKKDTKVLWEGSTGRIGDIIFTAKISLFICLILEIAVGLIAVLFDIGISNKWQAFLILQVPVVMLTVMIFFLGCLQARGFSYIITDKWVCINYGHSQEIYNIKDIIGLKIKYGFWERDKQHGTIKVKVRNRWLAPLKNHLYSIAEPGKVLDILQNCINNIENVELSNSETDFDYDLRMKEAAEFDYDVNKRRFTFKDEKSDKFWHVNYIDKYYYVHYGRNDTFGRIEVKEAENEDACKKFVEKTIAEKLGKGYKEINDAIADDEFEKAKGGCQPALDSMYFMFHEDEPLIYIAAIKAACEQFCDIMRLAVGNKEKIINAVKAVVLCLNQYAEDPGLIETEERDILGPWTDAVAALAGYKDPDDLAGEWREW